MKLFDYTSPKMIVADVGKKIRNKDDIYTAEYINEHGNVIPEHQPCYSSMVFVPDSFTEEQMYELYVEEEV